MVSTQPQHASDEIMNRIAEKSRSGNEIGTIDVASKSSTDSMPRGGHGQY